MSYKGKTLMPKSSQSMPEYQPKKVNRGDILYTEPQGKIFKEVCKRSFLSLVK